MARFLIIYSTTDGHTREICECLRDEIELQSHDVDLVALHDEPDVDLSQFDRIVVGASIRYGKHRPQVYNFIRANRTILETRPCAFFSVNVVARKPGKNQPDTNPYLKKFLKQLTWKPAQQAVFAGKIDYPLYGFWDRQIIRFIMWLTNGPTDPKTVIDYTDWEQVKAFARSLCKM